MLRTGIIAAAFLGLASCTTVGRDFARPDPNVPDHYAAAPAAPGTPQGTKWWRELEDPVLNKLVEQGLTQNFEIQAARARLNTAEALVATTGTNSQLSGDLTASATVNLTNDGDTTTSAQFSPSFLFDLFGGRAREAERARANVQAAAFEAESVRLNFQHRVVTTYINLRYFERALSAQQRAISNRAQLVSLLREQAEEGEVSTLEIKRAEAELLSVRARVPELQAERDAAALSLATLLGVPAKNIHHVVTATGRGQPLPPAAVDIGYPANLLRNRPDILQAEARLAAAVASAGVAEAELFPTLRLDGQITMSSDSTVTFGPRLSVPVLDLPVRRARLRAAQSRIAEAEIAWRQEILGAVEDVQVALVRLQQAQTRRNAVRRTVAVYEESLALTEEARARRLVALPELLDTQADLTDSRVRLAAARRDVALAWAQLQVAVGNGWRPGL